MRSIIQHLRFPFSYLLLPVFLMGLFYLPLSYGNAETLLLFFILHILVYPSSNAYNSLQDQDQGSIGLVKKPLPADNRIAKVSITMDALAILLSLFISISTAICILVYILASRLYSFRKIRLKKFPIIGFLVVFIFQGAWIFMTVVVSHQGDFNFPKDFFSYALAASCLIGAIYPLSQIYQHESDKADGVITISYLLGKRGTFIFSGVLFLIGSILILLPSIRVNAFDYIFIYLLFQSPSLTFFNYWFFKVLKNEQQANFKNAMIMSLLSATCMNAYFIYWIYCIST